MTGGKEEGKKEEEKEEKETTLGKNLPRKNRSLFSTLGERHLFFQLNRPSRYYYRATTAGAFAEAITGGGRKIPHP